MTNSTTPVDRQLAREAAATYVAVIVEAPLDYLIADSQRLTRSLSSSHRDGQNRAFIAEALKLIADQIIERLAAGEA